MPNKVVINIVGQDDVSAKLKAIRAEFDDTSSSKGWQSIVQGAAMGIGMAAWNAIGGSIQGVASGAMDAVNAFAADEASISTLTASLQANVKGWDGNTKAIEDVITARMKLGFDDVDQRASLALIAAKTGDVTEALNIERAAMDLARLKGIDLASSSKAIVMGMEGSGKALKELGINVKDYTNKADVLTAVQQKAAGQAEAFGNTTAGAMAAAGVSIGEVSEAIGGRLAPVVKGLADYVRDNAIPAFDGLATSLDSLTDHTSKEVDGIQGFVGWLNNMRDGLLYGDEAAWKAARGAAGLEAALVPLADAEYGAGTRAREMAAQLESTGTAAADAVRHQQGYADATRLINEWSYKARVELPQLAEAFKATAAAARANRLDAAYGIAELPLQVAIAAQAVKDAAKVIKENPLDPQAKLDLLEAQKNLDEWKAKLKAEGPNALIIGKELGDQLGSGLYQKVMAWNALTRADLARLGQGILTPATPGGNRNIDLPGKALGGPVSPLTPYLVGERGPEVFVPGMSGTILPGVGGGIDTVNITVNEASTPRQTADSVLLELRRQLTRQGMSLQ
jgi:hypothetical protein